MMPEMFVHHEIWDHLKKKYSQYKASNTFKLNNLFLSFKAGFLIISSILALNMSKGSMFL